MVNMFVPFFFLFLYYNWSWYFSRLIVFSYDDRYVSLSHVSLTVFAVETEEHLTLDQIKFCSFPALRQASGTSQSLPDSTRSIFLKKKIDKSILV